MIELTIQQACKDPANFMYIWASKSFLNAIDAKHAAIIQNKQLNQRKLIQLSAEHYNKKEADYLEAIRKAFVETYGINPAKALVALASGKTVAGKNWKEGIYGIGSLSSKFYGTDISVNPTNGYMMRNGSYLPVYDTVEQEVKGKVIAYQLFYYDAETGRTYMSQYNKTMKKYYAQTYTTSDGNKYSATTGAAVTSADGADLWGNIKLGFEDFKQIINWILSLFGIKITDDGRETINATNTLPDQTADGFTIESGFGEMAGIALLAVGAGTLLAGGLKKSKK